MNTNVRDTAVTALLFYQDALRVEIRLAPEFYRKMPGTRYHPRRARMARNLWGVRRALRDLQPRPWPAWYQDSPLEAYHYEGR